jgi:RHS repeat-associated protein
MVRPSYLSGAKADTGAAVTLEAFKYLGASTVIERARPEINTTLSMVSPTGAAGPVGDKYTGLDRFDRVVLQRWANGPGGNGAIVAQNAYSYDRNGNRLTDSIYGANYTYDNLNQVQSFTRAAWAPGLESQQFAFDALGNWNTLTTDGSAQSRVTNAQNELIDVGGVTLAYTPTGNMIVDNEFRILRYDAWNRLVTVSDEYGTLLARYQYDALNRRITEQVATPTIPDAGDAPIRDLYYSDQWQVLEERVRPSLGVVASTADTRYIWSPVYVDALIARDRNADSNAATGTGGLEERVYALQDANWNTHAIVAASTGQVINRFIYTPFGTHQVLDAGYLAAAPAIPWDRLFQGHEYTDATKLTHMRNRDYSGALGRFVQRDPIGFAAGDNNLYRFVGNGPTVSTDPSGLQSPSRQQLLGGGAPQRSGAGEVAVPEGLRPGDTFYAEIPGFDGPVPIVYRPDLGGSNGYPSAQACGRGPEIGADTRTPYQRYRSDLLMQMRSATWTHERAAAMDEYYLGGPMTTEQAYSESFNVALSMLPVFAVRPGRCGPRRTGHGPFGYPSGKTIPTPSRVLPEPKVLQTGGHTLSKGTIKALGIDRSRAHQALTALKKENGLGAKDHGHRFLDNGDVVDSNTGRVLGNLFDYL